MIAKWQWLMLQLTRTLWVRAALFSVLALFTALVAIVLEPYIPSDLPAKIGAGAVDNILNILATSMLAVTTFSLTVMVSAYSAAASSVTPRATRLLMQDSTTQNVLSTFLGSFLFSLVGIVALSTGAYGQQGRLVLFIVSIFVIVVIVVTMLRWIEHLTRFGRVADTTQRVEQAAMRALTLRIDSPYLGAQPLPDAEAMVPSQAQPICPESVGYVQHIDIENLSQIAEKHELQIFVAAQPGSFVHMASPLVWVQGKAVRGVSDAIQSAFSIDAERSFDQDPRFGLCVLSEIASRALSPAMNDAGTAIDVVGRAVRVLSKWKNAGSDPSEEVKYPRIWVQPILVDDLFDDIFMPIMRDGAGNLEVQLRLQRAFYALAILDPGVFLKAAIRHSRLAAKHANKALGLDAEKTQVSRRAAKVAAVSENPMTPFTSGQGAP